MFQEDLPLHPCVQCEQALPQEGCGNTWKKYLTEGNIKRIFFSQTIVGPCDSNVAFARLVVARSRLNKNYSVIELIFYFLFQILHFVDD